MIEQKTLLISVTGRAYGLCIGSHRLVRMWKEGGKFKHARIFLHHAE